MEESPRNIYVIKFMFEIFTGGSVLLYGGANVHTDLSRVLRR